MSSRIEDYAMIGDCITSALVGRNGSIDWLCWPRFDSAACFASLLGDERHGFWQIAPRDACTQIQRRYRPGTLILETTFTTATGAVLLIDFMPMQSPLSHVMRIVVGLRGSVAMRMEMHLRFDYGNTIPWLTALSEVREAEIGKSDIRNANGMRAVAGPNRAVLRSPVQLAKNLIDPIEFTIEEGQRVPFTLTYDQSHLPMSSAPDAEAALQKTQRDWRTWVGTCKLDIPWREQIERSLITLKALTYAPTGGVVAAPTTSLPERLGGIRNWDYRYCWVRDATLTLLTLMSAGYYDEAEAWCNWLVRATAGSPQQLQIMYGIGGERCLDEYVLPWLPGYENAAPVRIGNAAATQLQLDVYGELMDTLYQARKNKLPLDAASWTLQVALLTHLESLWMTPDEGIWEVRGGRQHFTFSKISAWVAFDRGVKSIEQFGLEGPRERWANIRDRIHDEVCHRGFDAERNTFVQSYGSTALDASLLGIAIVGFLPPEDPRVIGTVAAIERDLMSDGLVRRYRTEEVDDGLPPGESFFLACSFWLADNYILQGRQAEAEALFERLLGLVNDVGLLSEQYDAKAQRLVGNFPQAFSHTALIHTALNLATHGHIVRERKQ